MAQGPVFGALKAWYIRTMNETPFELHTFTFCREDWERIHRALIAYGAHIEADKSEAAYEERAYTTALASDIYFKL